MSRFARNARAHVELPVPHFPRSYLDLWNPRPSASPSRWRTILRAVLVAVLVLCAIGLWTYFEIWIPNKTLGQLEWVKTATPEQIRAVSHQVISHRIGNHHDAFLLLNAAGNEESIPYLIRALAWQQGPGAEGAVPPSFASRLRGVICMPAAPGCGRLFRLSELRFFGCAG